MPREKHVGYDLNGWINVIQPQMIRKQERENDAFFFLLKNLTPEIAGKKVPTDSRFVRLTAGK